MNKINKDILNKIRQHHAPRMSEEQLLERLVEDKEVRYKKEVLKMAVKQYYINEKRIQQQSKSKMEEVIILDKVKKKRKVENDFVYQPKSQYSIDNLGGIDQVLKQIQHSIFTPISKKEQFSFINVKPSKGFLIVGSMGSGKTHLGLSILTRANQDYQINTYYVTSSEIINNAQQALNKLFKATSQNQPAMVFIDDLDHLCSKQNRKNSSALLSLIGHLNKAEQQEVYLVASTSSPEKVDMGLKRTGRFDRQITIDNPNEQCRAKILEKIFVNVKTTMKGKELQLANMTAGYVASDLVGLVKQSALQSILRMESITKENGDYSSLAIQQIDFRKGFTKIEPLSKKQGFTSIPDIKLEDVGALGQQKEKLWNSIILPLKQKAKFQKFNIPLCAGVLLHGPPGCGKTMLAKAIAGQAKANFITVKGPELLSKYVGQSQQAVRRVFQRAKLSAPCIIFFDEFDAIATKRQDQGNQVTERVVNTLLNELNGVEQRKMVFVIAATNRFDMIDQAITRSGRMETHLHIPLPTPDDRVLILKAILHKIKVSEDVDIETIAKHDYCHNFTGADLNHLVKQACIIAIVNNREEVNKQDLKMGLEKLRNIKKAPNMI